MHLTYKARQVFFCVLLMVVVLLSVPASANIWDLPNGLLELFESQKAYETYSSGAKDAMTKKGKPQNIAVFTMESRNHSELFVCRENSDHVWHIEAQSTAAVYQPEDVRNHYPKIDLIHEERFAMAYQGDRIETYVFAYEEEQWLLTEAKILSGTEELSYHREGNRLTIDSANVRLGELPTITLENFNICQIPKSEEEAQQLLQVAGHFLQSLPQPTLLQTNEKGKLPVFSGPQSSSFRAANKKATVSLAGDVFGYGTQNGWVMIEYAIQPGKNRVGWIQSSDIQGSLPDIVLQNVSALTVQDTFLTDDPHVGQAVLVSVDAGTQVRVQSILKPWWAYVAVHIGSTLYYGMIPLAALNIGE